MEKKQNLDWCFICKFSAFAQAYTGLQNDEEIIAFIAENDQIYYVRGPKNGEFLTKKDLHARWNEYVEIRVNCIMENNGIATLNLDFCGASMQCDCVDPNELLITILK